MHFDEVTRSTNPTRAQRLGGDGETREVDVCAQRIRMLPRDSRSSEPSYLADTSHGLASNQAHRIARDAQARMWIASPVGLARFDGNFIERWDRGRGLQCNGLRTVAVGIDGGIWIGTDLGLERLDAAGAVVPQAPGAVWPFGLCQHVAPDADGAWVGTARGLVRLQRHGPGPDLLPGFVADVGFVSDVLPLAADRVLVASAVQGLIEADGRGWWNYRCEGLVGRRVSRLAQGHGRHLLVATDHGLLVVDDDSATVVMHVGVAGAGPAVTALAVGDDRYWAAFGRTVAAFSTDPTAPQLLEWLELDSPVNDLLLDALGNLWIATNNTGLALLSCLRHAVQRIDLGPAGEGAVFSIKAGSGDRLAIGGEHLYGVAALPPAAGAAKIEAPPGLPDTVVWDSLETAEGTWAATQAGLFLARPGQPFQRMFASDLVVGAPGRVLLERDGDLWVGTLRGLAVVRDGSPEAVEAPDGSLGYIYALHLDHAGRLWIATLGRGLWREHGGLSLVAPPPLTAQGNTYAVSQGPDGRIVVVQDEQVVVLDSDLSTRPVAALPPVAGWTVLWLDPHTLALGASDGLRVVDIESGQVRRHVRSLLRLRDWEFTNNRTLVRDTAGRLLCGLSGGLVRLDLQRLQGYEPPNCQLLDIVWRGAQPLAQDGEVRMRPGRWSFRLRAYCAWFVDSTLVQVQFQLIGFDADWQAWQDQPAISYNSLPSGRYRLMARARSPLTGEGPATELLRLHVSRPLWTLGWARALAALEAGFDAVVRARRRNQALLATNQRLERAVRERTASLQVSNRELLSLRDAYQRLSEVDELTQIGNRRCFDKELARCLAMSQRTGEPLALLMVDIDHFKAVNDRHGHPTGDAYLRIVGGLLAKSVRTAEDVPARYGGEEFAVLLQNTDAEGARVLAERMRALVESQQLRNDGAASGIVTLSIGVATTAMPGVDGEAALVAQADQALYRAKREGRNRVAIAAGMP